MEKSDEKNIQRSKSTNNDTTVDNEVQKLLRKEGGKINQIDFANLRRKYNNEELVEKIEKAYIEIYADITKKAKKFAKLIREKYSDSKYPFHILLEKAYKYKQKYGLTDEEFSEFQRRYESELVGLKSPDVFQPTTNLSKVLGDLSVNTATFGKINDVDYKVLQDILALHMRSRPLHSQVLLQSIQYEDCGLEARSGVYNRDTHNVANHVHPVIAALFFPKIDIIDSHFIHSNISNIVRTRYQNEGFSSIADAQLHWALSRDPNDIICDPKSIMIDLLNRAQLQNQLWNSILALRNGQYFNNSFPEFINSVDACRLNKYDNPDLIYGRSDGTILKRLLTAFSFRPTVVSTTSIYPVFNTNPYQQNVMPIVTLVHMINLKLPSYAIANPPPINLRDALDQNQLFIENGNLVPKRTSLIYSSCLIFFIDRRSNVIKVDDQYNPYNMNKLPIAIAGYERINLQEVQFQNKISIREDDYLLRSVVLSETNKLTPNQSIVVGSSAAFMLHQDPMKNQYGNSCLKYDPYSIVVGNTVQQRVASQNRPIFMINETPTLAADGTSFQEMARTRGVIFIYALDKKKDQSNDRLY